MKMGVVIRRRQNVHLLAIEPQTPKTLSRIDIINCIGDVSPLSHFFKTTTYDGIERYAGLGVRRYSGQSKNYIDPLKDGFIELARQMLLIKQERRSHQNVSFEYGLYLKKNALTMADYPRSSSGSVHRAHENKINVELGDDTVDSAQKVTLRNHKINGSTQTDDLPSPREITFMKLPKLRDACVDTQDLKSKEPTPCATVSGSALPAALTTAPVTQRSSTRHDNNPLAGSLSYQPPVVFSSTAIPSSLLGQYQNNVSARSTTAAVPSFMDTPSYERAKNWQPQNEEQIEAYKQAEQEIYLMLVVGQGVRFNSLCSEFLRVTQVSLDFTKIGVPDLKTLLVKMRDLIFLKKHYHTGDVYIFPNKSTPRFQSIAHIEELVHEQRNDRNIIPDPSSSFLVDMDIQELFIDALQNHRASLQSATYGPYSQTPYNYWNAYGSGNGSRHQSYQWANNYQYQQQYAYHYNQYLQYSQYQRDLSMYLRQY